MRAFEDVQTLFQRMEMASILVVGDLILDEYLYGKTERISPEAPVPVVHVDRESHRPGGAGNVALNLAALGCSVSLAGVVGDDRNGTLLRQLLEDAGVDTTAVLICEDRCTTRKTRLIAQQQQMLRIDQEERTAIIEMFEKKLLGACMGILGQVDVVLLSDYAKGVLTPELIAGLIAACRAANVPVLIDPKGQDFSKYHGATLLTPNRKELATAVNCDLNSEAILNAQAESLRHKLDLSALIVTRSEEGMSLFCRDSGTKHLPTRAREVYDISGAGDTVLAALGAAIAAGCDFVTAATFANYAAGIVVGKAGTAAVSAVELRKTIAAESLGISYKMLTGHELVTMLAPKRAEGARVVFTNGCFDLLHVGHVKYLEKARQLGDLLVLGLNSDVSIRRLKGEKRPLIGEEERSQILAALDCVDFIVLFDEDTPFELIKLIRPDVLVKGSDYTAEQVVGRDFVESYGGRLELIQFVDGKSTSNIINKILESYQND